MVGGYGNAGEAIVDLLLAHCTHRVVIAGRHENRAAGFADQMRARHPDAADRIGHAAVDADRPETFDQHLASTDLCLVAAGTSPSAEALVAACLAAGCGYLDIQVSRAKAERLLALDARARAAGVVVVTDGGFHPGLPAAMIRAADARYGPLRSAFVSSVIAIDWAALRPFADSTVAELLEEFRDYSYEEYRDGRWRRARRQRKAEFPAPFGQRTVAPMRLAEMHQVTAALPTLRDAGFFVGGFNPVTDYVILPVVWAGLKIAPVRLAPPLGRLLRWGLARFSRPPFDTILQLDGAVAGEPTCPLLRVRHPDGYLVTAAPTVAAALQVLDGTAGAPGVHTQAMLVEPARFLADIASFGVTVEWVGPDRL